MTANNVNTRTTIRPSQLRNLLSLTIPAREPILISGPPGVGKSDIVAQACAAANAECIVMHPVVSDPTDFKGMPWVTDKGATFMPFGELQALINADKPTACFLDDLGQAMPAVQAAAMQLVLARRVNGQHVSPNVVFLAATNRREDRAAVSGILEPVKSRFTLLELRADLADWAAWATSAKIAPSVIAFLRSRPALLSAFAPSADISNSPCPRTWAAVSRLLSMNLPPDLQLAAVEGAVGQGAAVEFVSFLRIWASMVNPDLVLGAPDTAPIPSEPSEMYALMTAIAMRVAPASMGRYCRYLERVHSAGRGEFAAVSLATVYARPEKVALTNTEGYVNAMSGALGALQTGG